MMTSILLHIIRKLIFFGAVFVALHHSGAADIVDTNAIVQVIFSPSKEAFLLGEPVIIDCKIINQTNKDIALILGEHMPAFEFNYITKSASVTVKLINVCPLSQIATIKPKTEFNYPIVLDQWLTFTTNGQYEVKCSLRTGAKMHNDKLGNSKNALQYHIKSEEQLLTRTVRIIIKDGDPHELKSLVKLMTKQIKDSTGIDSSQEEFWGKAMSYFHSTDVIPELKAAASTTYLTPEIIKAFRRIGGPEAKQALQELSKSDNDDLASVAKAELYMMEKGSKEEFQIFD